MKKTEINFDAGTLPEAIMAYARQARIYDSSCSETGNLPISMNLQPAILHGFNVSLVQITN